MPQYSVALKHCSAVAVQDSDVQKQCGDLAEVFVAKGTNHLDRIRRESQQDAPP